MRIAHLLTPCSLEKCKMQSAKCKVAADRGPDQFAICILHFYLCLRLAAAASAPGLAIGANRR